MTVGTGTLPETVATADIVKVVAGEAGTVAAAAKKSGPAGAKVGG